jgi:antitoxin component YwqK of YwqJK toxin-antitoxin module
MKTIKIIFFFLLLSPVVVFAQELNKSDAKGRKTGKWVVKHENGITRYTGEFKEGKPIGEFRYFYESGDLKSVVNFKSDGKTSYGTFYYSAEDGGKKMSEGKYIDQKKDSTWTYYDGGGAKTYTQEFKDDLENGKRFIYYVSGKKSEAFTYVNGKKEGDWAQYFEKGTKRASGKYVNDLLHGKLTYYYSSTGKPEQEIMYKNGVVHGLTSAYDEDGKLLKEIYVKNGEPVSDSKVAAFKEELKKEAEEEAKKDNKSTNNTKTNNTKTNTTKSTSTTTKTTTTKTATNATKK